MSEFVIDLSNVNEKIQDKSIGFNKLAIDKLRSGQSIQSENYDDNGNGWKISGDGTHTFGGNFYSSMETRTTSQGTGDVTITTNFQPKLIKVFAIADVSGGWGGWSMGSTTTTGGKCMAYAHSGGGVWEKLYNESHILFVWDNGESNNTKASVSSITSTGLILNFDAMNVNVRYIIDVWG